MSRHFDPLCPYSEATQVVSDVPGPLAYCQCDLIARVRADERADLRAQVEALRAQHGPGRAHDHEYTYPCSRCDALEEVLSLIVRGRQRMTGKEEDENPYCMRCGKHLGMPFHETNEHDEAAGFDTPSTPGIRGV